MARAAAIAALLAMSASAGWCAEKASRKAAPSALIAGTVFRESGLSLPGAEVTIEPVPPEGKKIKRKAHKLVADSRGEFAFRVPPGPMRYVILVQANGFKPGRQEIQVQDEERVDVSIVLAANGPQGARRQ